MALAEMQKVRVAVHESVLGDLMPKIQELGCCHFVSQDEQDGHGVEGALSPVRTQLRSVDDLLGEVRFAMRFLDPFVAERGSAVSRIMGDVPEYSIAALEKATPEPEFRDLTLKLRSFENSAITSLTLTLLTSKFLTKLFLISLIACLFVAS